MQNGLLTRVGTHVVVGIQKYVLAEGLASMLCMQNVQLNEHDVIVHVEYRISTMARKYV